MIDLTINFRKFSFVLKKKKIRKRKKKNEREVLSAIKKFRKERKQLR